MNNKNILFSQEEPHSVAIHPDGRYAVVGFRKPMFIAIDLRDGSTIYEDNDVGREQIQCCEYSPDGKLLALGSRDNHIYIFEVHSDATGYRQIGKCSVSEML